MRTNDTTNYQNMPHLTMNQEYENSDSISQRDTENSDIFDNFTLCQKYGQSNIEKAILLLLSISIISGLILYYNIKLMKSYFIRILCVSSIIDLLLLLLYCFLRIKFNSEEWFNSFPIRLFNCIDYIIILNFIIKVAIFIMSFFYKQSIGSFILFCFKFILELYLLMSCVKILIFFPGYKNCEEIFEKAIGWIKYLLICSENDNDYKKVNGESSNTSNWEEISDNQLQMS